MLYNIFFAIVYVVKKLYLCHKKRYGERQIFEKSILRDANRM